MWPRSQNEQVRSQITAYRDNERLNKMSVPKTFLLAEPFRLRKITADPHILTHVRPDDRYSKLNIYISELILDSILSSHPVILLACDFAFCAMRYQMQPLSLADYMLHRPRSSWLHKTFPWKTKDPWLEFRHGQVFYPLKLICAPKCLDRIWDTSSLLLNGYRDSFPAENGRGVKLTTYLHLMSRLNMGRSTRSTCLHRVYRENYLDRFTDGPVGLNRYSGSNGSHEPLDHKRNHSHDRSLMGL
jgi:hypothetical protein